MSSGVLALEISASFETDCSTVVLAVVFRPLAFVCFFLQKESRLCGGTWADCGQNGDRRGWNVGNAAVPLAERTHEAESKYGTGCQAFGPYGGVVVSKLSS